MEGWRSGKGLGSSPSWPGINTGCQTAVDWSANGGTGLEPRASRLKIKGAVGWWVTDRSAEGRQGRHAFEHGPIK